MYINLFLNNTCQFKDHADQEGDHNDDDAGKAKITVTFSNQRQKTELCNTEGQNRTGQGGQTGAQRSFFLSSFLSFIFLETGDYTG